jgi:hypothetical protein
VDFRRGSVQRGLAVTKFEALIKNQRIMGNYNRLKTDIDALGD